MTSNWCSMMKIKPINSALQVTTILCILWCKGQHGNYSDKTHLGFHIWTAGMGSKSRQMSQGLGLLLQRHDAVLLKHLGGFRWTTGSTK